MSYGMKRIHCTPAGIVQYPLHMHNNYEIMLYLSGEGHLRTDHGDIPFRRGTVVIVPPRIRHGSVSMNGFKNISVEGSFSGYLQGDSIEVFLDNESHDGERLATMLYENRYGNERYVDALCMTYLCYLSQRVRGGTATEEQVKRIVFDISQNALDPSIDLTAILKASGYAVDYIRSCFKKTIGKTPHTFLTELRIRHACFLIDVYRDRLSLSEIAERCGYLDYVDFSKKFRSIMGVSPRVYKKA